MVIIFQGLAAFLKAIGYLIPLMDAEYANYYTREVMLILIREFQSPDEEMKKIVLKVVKQCCATDGVEPQYIKDEILPPFFKHFWNQRMALERRNYRQVCAVIWDGFVFILVYRHVCVCIDGYFFIYQVWEKNYRQMYQFMRCLLDLIILLNEN